MPKREVSEEEIKTTVIKHFTSYYKKSSEEDEDEEEAKEDQGPNFATVRQFVDETTCQAEDVIYSLLTGILEEKYELIC